MVTLTFLVTPNPKVRMTKRDTWGNQKVRPAVQKWRAFRDRVQELGVKVLDGDSVVFVMPMPASWSQKKREAHSGKPHRQKPDLDNLLGGLFDAAMPEEDKELAELGGLRKVWGNDGAILLTRKE